MQNPGASRREIAELRLMNNNAPLSAVITRESG
jgi:hypothetical protein